MQKRTYTMMSLMLMTGLFAGRFVSFHDLKVAELTGLSLLLLCHAKEIWEAIQQFATRPAVRASVAPRAAQIQGFVISMGLLKKLALVAGVALGGLMLILDAIHRHS